MENFGAAGRFSARARAAVESSKDLLTEVLAISMAMTPATPRAIPKISRKVLRGWAQEDLKQIVIKGLKYKADVSRPEQGAGGIIHL